MYQPEPTASTAQATPPGAVPASVLDPVLDPVLDAEIADTITPEQADPAARTYWEAAADEYQAEHGAFLGGTDGVGFIWGPEGLAEEQLQLLGPTGELAGAAVLEVGCGGGQAGRWLAARGAAVVGIDISVAMLRHARCGPAAALPVAAATATALPFAPESFDVAFTAYGAIPFIADLGELFREVHRVLRPGGRWVYSTLHPIRWAFPDDPGWDGLKVTMSYFGSSAYVERDGGGTPVYAEFHHPLAQQVNDLVAAGFCIDRMIEPEWPEWNDQTWNGWSPLRGAHIPGTIIIGSRKA